MAGRVDQKATVLWSRKCEIWMLVVIWHQNENQSCQILGGQQNRKKKKKRATYIVITQQHSEADKRGYISVRRAQFPGMATN